MKFTVVLAFFLQITGIWCACNYLQPQHAAMDRITPLIGSSWSSCDAEIDPKYEYTVAICVSATEDESDDAGVIQREVNKDKPQTFVVGRINATLIKGGADWVYLEYRQGQPYGHSCGHENRNAHIMILCDESETQGKLTVIEENKNKTKECYYLFELAHAAMCTPKDESGLSVGTVICIVFLVVVGLYLIGGFAYQRLIVGAKGWEQVPNYAFWQDFGNLQADGCDFICRTRPRSASREYRGIGDDQLRNDDEESGKDDHLLPM